MVSQIMIVLLLVGMSTSALNIRSVGAIPTTIIVPDNYATIQGAINNANDGDTVFVRNGTYYEHLTVNKTVELIGENENSTFVDGGNYGTVVNVIADNVSISGFTIRKSEYDSSFCGVYIISSGNHIHQNIITGNFYGLRFWYSTNNSVVGNDITNNNYGVRLDYCSKNTLLENNIERNVDYGVYLRSGSSNVLIGNKLAGNSRGLFLYDASGTFVSKNTVTGNSDCGICLSSSNHNSITSNSITSNGFGGPDYHSSLLLIERSTFNSIIGNNITNSEYGIRITDWSDFNNISKNTIEANSFGIWIDWAAANSIYKNNFVTNTNQVYSHGNVINTWDDGYPSGGNYWSDYVGSDAYSGIYQNENGSDGMGDGPYVIDAKNRDSYPLMGPCVPFENQTIYIRADGSIDPSGAPILRKGDLYTLTGNISSNADGIVIERDNMTLDGAGYTLQGTETSGSIGVALHGWRSNIIIKNMKVAAFYYGVYLYGSSNCTVEGNNITNNVRGAYLQYSLNCTVSGNNITSNGAGALFQGSFNSAFFGNNMTKNDCPVLLDDSFSNAVYGNNITSNNEGVRIQHYSHNNAIYENSITNIGHHSGIELWFGAINNVVYRNNITFNGYYGIWIHYGSDNNTFYENNVANNYYGIYVETLSDIFSSNNVFYHNNFVNNTVQAYAWQEVANFWDNGYPSGGNYWSDYSGADVLGGPFQNETGSDGIGDTQYIIDVNNTDHYPLMNPYGSPPSPTYDLAIIATAGGATNPTFGAYNYVNGSSIHVTAFPNTNYNFDHWELDTVSVGSTNPYTILMNSNHTLKAVFIHVPPLVASINPVSASIYLGQSVTFNSTTSGGTSPYSYQWYVNNNPVSSATSASWTFTPTTSGIYYIHLKVTDAKANTAQSETARITAPAVPVGGYSYQIQVPPKTEPLLTYITLIVTLAAIFTKLRPKTRRKR
jgi:parallel beta-helix repeat protein